jgi:hypothetical protein
MARGGAHPQCNPICVDISEKRKGLTLILLQYTFVSSFLNNADRECYLQGGPVHEEFKMWLADSGPVTRFVVSAFEEGVF